jgi:hypothetical protein
MLYMNLKQGLLRVVVLATHNVEAVLKGQPAVAPDGSVVVAWTPDPAWLGAQLKTARSPAQVGSLIDEATRRPQQPVPPHFPAEEHMLTGMSGTLPEPEGLVAVALATAIELDSIADALHFEGHPAAQLTTLARTLRDAANAARGA